MDMYRASPPQRSSASACSTAMSIPATPSCTISRSPYASSASSWPSVTTPPRVRSSASDASVTRRSRAFQYLSLSCAAPSAAFVRPDTGRTFFNAFAAFRRATMHAAWAFATSATLNVGSAKSAVTASSDSSDAENAKHSLRRAAFCGVIACGSIAPPSSAAPRPSRRMTATLVRSAAAAASGVEASFAADRETRVGARASAATAPLLRSAAIAFRRRASARLPRTRRFITRGAVNDVEQTKE